MSPSPSELDWASWITAIGTVVLGFATIALAWLTWVLAKATNRPSIVVSIEPSPWAIIYADLHVVNEGNASAFDISLNFEPPLPTDDNRAQPFRHLSLLRSGQTLTSFIGAFKPIDDLKMFEITIGWRERPRGRRHSMSYTFDMASFNALRELGGNPLVSMAQQLKKVQEHLGRLGSGHSRFEVDVFTTADRAEAEAALLARWAAQEESRAGASDAGIAEDQS